MKILFRNIYVSLIVTLLLMPGCGLPKKTETNVTDMENLAGTTGWSGSEFALKTENILDDDWFCREYYALSEDIQTEADYTEYDTALSGEQFFWLEKQFTTNSARYFLGDRNGRIGKLTCEDWEISDGFIRGMYSGGEGNLLFAVTTGTGVNRENQTVGYFLVKTDGTGKLIDKRNIQDFLVEKDLYSYGQYRIEVLGVDNRGYYYLNDLESGYIYVLDTEGQFCMAESYLSGERKYSFSAFPTSGGELLFAFQAGNKKELFCLDAEKKSKVILTHEFPKAVSRWYGMAGWNIYYSTREALYRWNVSTGEQTKLVSLEENGARDLSGSQFLATDDGLEFMVLDKKEGLYVLRFRKGELENSENISIVNISGGHSESLGGACAAFGRKNPAFQINYKTVSEEAEIDRVLADVMNGRGPDLLNVSFDQMETLGKKGCLANYSVLVTEEILDNLRPGIRSFVGKQGEIYGLPFSYHVETMFTSKDYWEKKSWTPADVVDIVGKRDDIKGMFTDYFGVDNYVYNMLYLLGKGIRKAPYITEKNGFGCEEFRDILVVVKEKTNQTTVEGTYWDIVAQEGYLGVPYYVYSLEDYCRVKKYLGEKGNLVGYPNYNGCGNYINTSDGGILVVNQSAKEKPEVSQLLEYLFGQKCQSELEKGISVRKDVKIKVTDEGVQFLEEYEDFLNHAVPNQSSEELFDIIMEEANSYFYSDKNLAQVIDVIQSRVNLYLEEGQ